MDTPDAKSDGRESKRTRHLRPCAAVARDGLRLARGEDHAEPDDVVRVVRDVTGSIG